MVLLTYTIKKNKPCNKNYISMHIRLIVLISDQKCAKESIAGSKKSFIWKYINTVFKNFQ